MTDLSRADLLSRLSHELRTPLNAILGFGQILEMGDLSAEQQRSIGHIMKAGHHLRDLIDDVLDLARIESGELELSLEPVRVAELLREASGLVAPLAAARAITVHGDLDSCGDRHVLADRKRLEQVMLALLANAVDYNRANGEVHVRCEPAGEERLRIVVADTGIGIAQPDLERLFAPFERLHPGHGGEGAGLGLTLARGLVEAMGGEVHVDSEIGRGSVFAVELAAVDAPAPAAAAARPRAAAPAAREPSGRPETVLYIEDNASNAKLVEAVLMPRTDVTLLVATQGHLGIDLAVEHRPGLVLLDLELPDMPGDEVLRRLRADPRTARTRIVIVSADATPRQIDRLKGLGADDHLGKPFEVARLVAMIDCHESGASPRDSAGPERERSALDASFARELSAMRSASAEQRQAVDELLRLFASDGEARLAGLRSAAARRDLGEVARAAHALAGSSSSVGAFELAEACRALERDARAGTGEVEAAIARLAAAFADARAALSTAFRGNT